MTIKKIRIKPWGNSQGIELSNEMLAQIGIDDIEHQCVTVEVKDNSLILKKAYEKSRLMRRFGCLIDEKRVDEFSFGKPLGNEII